MPRTKYQVISAIFDIKPVNENGEINFEKLSNVEAVLNLGRKLRIGKSGQPSLRNNIKNQVSSIKYKKPKSVIDKSEILNTKYVIHNTDPKEELERYLNEDLNPTVELAAVGAEVVAKHEEPAENYEAALRQINEKFSPADSGISMGEPKRIEFTDWWHQKLKNQNEKIKVMEPEVRPIHSKPRIQIPKIILPSFYISSLSRVCRKVPSVKLSSKKVILTGLLLIFMGLLTEYGFSMKNEIVLNGNSAVANLESAGENIKNLDFDAASTNFSQAYSDFAEAGDNLNFMGATMSSLIADLPGGAKLRSAKKLVEAGKLMADAGQAMSQAMAELAKTGGIFNPAGSNVSAGGISKNLRQALTLSQKNIKEAGELLEDVDAGSLPEDKRASFEEFNSKLPEFEQMITDAADYSKFLEDFIGTAGTRKYLLLFQNPAELRPTGGFPGSYGVVVFKDGRLQDFRVDDVYNLDGQLKELYVPPLQLQHITPNWGMRDANWFVDFPVSARKMSEFYKKESGEDVDGVITFSPQIVSKILEITGPIRMDKYGVTLNSENFSQAIQEEVEYKADRNQPKKILVDLAPLMLEKIYSADSDTWMEIFNILVSSLDGKGILMYFRDLKLQDFSVTKGFSGQVNQTNGDYLMVTLTNVKGSKTDTVIDSELKVDSIFEGDDIRHRVVLTRTHNGGGTKFGFFNKQNPAYVRILVPDNAQFLGISGNSKPNFQPLLDYPKTDFKRDEDLVRFEEKSNYDSETGVTTYEEAGKREYGFWMLLNPGETKAVELEYRVLGKAAGKEHEFYVQRQPGLEFNKFTLNLISGAAEIGQSSVELRKGNGRYTFNGKLDRDLPIKVIFR
ncbi:MAG: DUF4012 domain-containing protein [Candidatus Yanofskybacteria bacterium]|nr:DUF4012 domain-containing protein [Candidatus Yanofskybacteria bacterium]